MAVCFACDAKLSGERTRVCASVTPTSKSTYPEKIGELLGEDFVIIVTPADSICKRCTSLLNHADKVEHDLKLVKNALLSVIQHKYGMLPADQTVKSIEIVDGDIKTDDLAVDQKNVPSSSLAVQGPSTSSASTSSASTSSASLNIRKESPKIKIYKCGFCTFQSKDLGHVRFHMRSHVKKNEGEKSNQNTVTKTTTQQPKTQQQLQLALNKNNQQPQQQPLQQQQPQQQQPQQPKKRLYRCQVCSVSYDTREECLDHIHNDHNQQMSMAEEKETEVTTEPEPIFQPPALNSTENQQVTIKSGDENHVINKDDILDMDLLLNDNIPDEGTEVTIKETPQDTSENMSGQTELMQVDQEETTITEMSDLAIGGSETGTDHLDIESMLAAIHNEVVPPPKQQQN